MRIIIQRVQSARVDVDHATVGAIGPGILALVGFGTDDTEATITPLLEKLVNLRIFSNDQGKFHFSLLDRRGELLLVPQFTLYADTSRGRRPGFEGALEPAKATLLFDAMVNQARALPLGKVSTGSFGAHMEVSLLNDGPVTILLDSQS